MNRLHRETSPYLLQHANNPVDWYPWGEEAFRASRDANKPIFLSIGYSTCHWCHVMAHESFEDEATAAVMNERFINIKVDREERPDIDRVYMAAVQAMTGGGGGWPLSVFLTPDLTPFYGGTYFPPKDAYGRPGFSTLLQRVSEVWITERENVIASGEELIRSLQHTHPVDTRIAELDDRILKRAYHQFAAGYDSRYAGFGSGPKFPRPAVFDFLFSYYDRSGEKEALTMSLTTLMAMASGGLYDHLGGGFHRYSVDGQWRVPHFEKMLYDQAQLVHSYLDAFQITGEKFFADIARDTVRYVLREMTSPEGGFVSAEDADSADPARPDHRSEGAYYVWSQEEVERILSGDEARVFCHYYGMEREGNAPADPHGEFQGKNILYAPFTLEQTAEHLQVAVETAASLLDSARKKVLAERARRPRPHRDDKVLASWNGLMIGACARASLVLDEPSFAAAATQAAGCLRDRMYDPSTGRLHRRFRNGVAGLEAHLDDYAMVIFGLLQLYTATRELSWLVLAKDLAGTMIALFWDSAEGGFFDTSGKDPSILVRTKEGYDGAEPSGNSVAVTDMLLLHRLLNDETLIPYIEKTLRYFTAQYSSSPQVMPFFLRAVTLFLSAPEHIVMVSDTNGDDLHPFIRTTMRQYLPNVVMVYLTQHSRDTMTARHPFLSAMTTVSGRPTVYHCKNFTCLLPATEPDELENGFKK